MNTSTQTLRCPSTWPPIASCPAPCSPSSPKFAKELPGIKAALRHHGHIVLELAKGDTMGEQMIALVSALGEASFHDEFGQTVWHVKPEASCQEEKCTTHRPTSPTRSLSMHEFTLHTDASFEDPTPRYVALYVLKKDAFGGGRSQLLAAAKVLAQLDPKTLDVLRNENFRFIVPDEFHKGCAFKEQPILFGDNRLRYRREIIDHSALAAQQRAALDRLDASISKATAWEFTLDEGEILIFDNARFLHGRTKIHDAGRHLLRMRFF